MRTLSSEPIIVQVALSHYLPFDYEINPKELKMEQVGRIRKSKVGIMHSHVSLGKSSEYFKIFSLLQRELSLFDVKMDTIHKPYKQINRQLIKPCERHRTIPIITLLEKISYVLTY
ncbi:hypothetical protein HZS_6356 [Henneguya salminicola]|nr:hypothetical protein HZS_6356 [Henneguya salminicola]